MNNTIQIFENKQLPPIRNFHYFGLGGVKKQRPYLVWTAEGLEFIKWLIDGILVSETRHP